MNRALVNIFQFSLSRGSTLFSTVLSVAVLLILASSLQGQNPQLNLPPRKANALTGSQFYEEIKLLNNTDREQRIINEIARGNIPDFLRELKPVTASGIVNGSLQSTTLYVSPDYLAIGSDADFFRMPMSAPLAQQVVDLLQCSMPTRKIVNDIHAAATVKLAPFPFSPSTYDIDSVDTFWLSQQAIENQRSGQALGQIVSGIKKDVVVTGELVNRPAPLRVAIYGWHQLNNQPIQPLSLVHENTYEDYSHGIRLVWNQINVGGIVYSLPQLLGSATLFPLVSDEGSFTSSVYPIPNPYVISLSENLLRNGSFEDAFTGSDAPFWTRWTAAGSAAITFGRASVNRVDGAASFYFARNDTQPFRGGIYQLVETLPGATYQLRIQMKKQSLLAGTEMSIGVGEPINGSFSEADLSWTPLQDQQPDNVWVQHQREFVAQGAQTIIAARGGHTGTTGGANSYFYLDAGSLFLISEAVPVVGEKWVVE